jgi:hypothetical protein
MPSEPFSSNGRLCCVSLAAHFRHSDALSRRITASGRLWEPLKLLSNMYVGGGGLFQGMKLLGIEAGHSSPSSVEVKNGGAIPLFTDISE